MSADLVFTGGRVLTAHAAPATTVAVRGSRIVAVGGDEVLHDLRDRSTEVVDLAGGLLTPGFTDAHVHPVQGGLERMHCDLSEATGRVEVLRAVRDYAESHPEREWILGGGWRLADFSGGTPTAADLDQVVPDRPVFLPNRDHHGAWVNSCALQLAGLHAQSPDPADGRIERDASGAPSGTLHEGAMDLVGRLVPNATHDEQVTALLEAQSYLHSLGITGWQDAILGDYANIRDAGPVYLELARDGRLTARVVGALWWDRARGAEQIPELVARREGLRHERLHAGSVKIMQDGVPENFTAGMLEPYLDACGCRTTNRGLSFVEPSALRAHVTDLDAAGFQVHVHAIGDRAVREALDAFELARDRNGVKDLRHHVAHIQVVHPDDVPRFGALDVAANMQPLWAAYERQMVDLTLPFLGPERSSRQYPFADIAAAGGRLVAGSDWPVTSPDPWAAIHVAVNRRAPAALADGDYDAFLPEQALDLASALSAYTAGSAWVNHLDDGGRIEVGALADLVVHDRDPFGAPSEEIADTGVEATFVAGRRVFAR